MSDTLQSKIPEAVASITYSLKTPNSFPVLFTMRGEGESSLLEGAEGIEAFLKESGYTANLKTYGGGRKAQPKTYVEGELCPECGSKLLDKTTKSGKRMHECEKRVYDFDTKKTTGCSYVKWLEDSESTVNIPVGVPATPKQVEILKEKNMWEEGMTKSKASEVIGGVLGK